MDNSLLDAGTRADLLAEISGQPWAILESRARAVIGAVTAPTATIASAAERAELSASMHRPGEGVVLGSVAVLPVQGIIHHRAGGLLSMFFGGTSTEALAYRVRELASDPAVKTIVFDVNSPGGTIGGLDELATEIREAGKKVRTVAVVNALAASAAYWIAASANEVVITPSGQAGSIGVFVLHLDFSEQAKAQGIKPTFVFAGKYKTEGNDMEPLTEDARAYQQQMVDGAYGRFVDDVAAGRGTSAGAVRSGFGQGRMVPAREAVTMGMADRVGTLEQTLARHLSAGGGNGLRAVNTKREFEALLRDAGGFSHAAAKAITAGGFKAQPRDEDAPDNPTKTNQPEPRDEDGISAAIDKITAKLKNHPTLRGSHAPRTPSSN